MIDLSPGTHDQVQDNNSVRRRALLGALAGAAFCIWVLAGAWLMTRTENLPPAVALFTVAACTAWALTLVWAARLNDKPFFRFFHLTAFLLATAFFILSESLGIRLGKYEYHQQFPLMLSFLGGAPTDDDLARRGLAKLASLIGTEVGIPGCNQSSWNVPFPIVALEAVFVFAFVRICINRIKNVGLPAALAAAGLNALLIVNLDAVLDPVLTISTWCGPMPDPGYHGLNIGLWHWYTNNTHPGYWFGVPVVNYFSWVVAVGAFSFFLRLESGPDGILRRHDHWLKYVLSGIVALLVLFLIQVPFKLALDWILIRGQEYLFNPQPVIDKRVWQFGLLAVLLTFAFRFVRRFGHFDPARPIDWISVGGHTFVFAICGVALWFTPSLPFKWRLWLVWSVSVVIASVVEFAPVVFPVLARFGAWIKTSLKL